MAVKSYIYGSMNGRDVLAFVIENSLGTKVQLITRGATLDKIEIKDKNGKFIDVLVGFDNLEGHINYSDYQGNIVGQCANRIKGGSFIIDGEEFNVTKNEEGRTCLHGGSEFNSAIWDAEILGDNAVKFSYLSPDKKEGFPGNVKVSVTYTLSDSDDITIDYKAISDKKTVINLTNHAYFNLNGFNGGSILDHELKINADEFTPIDETSIPLGTLEPVENTPFDFREPKKIGRDINENHIQLKMGNGYDHNFCIKNYDGSLKEAAAAKSDKSGLTLVVKTTCPGVQLYTANFFDSTKIGKGQIPMAKRTAFCLETQYYPDSPNNPQWPTCIYDKGEEYRETTVFSFRK